MANHKFNIKMKKYNLYLRVCALISLVFSFIGGMTAMGWVLDRIDCPQWVTVIIGFVFLCLVCMGEIPAGVTFQNADEN